MTSALIFLLFVLNAILIFTVVLLYMRQNRLMEMEKAQQKVQAETEELMTSFLLEIKEENQFFMSKLDDLRKTQQAKDMGDDKSEETVERENQQEDYQPGVEMKNFTRMQAEKAYLVNYAEQLEMKENEGDIEGDIETLSDENLFTDQVHSLHAKGLSIEEIAQRLNKGKTEVTLALKFKNMHS
ncbi:hypothetical protein [Lederbergia galactosidilytica]|uniref:Coupling factor for flagellin transcription and translation n=1 Tax=Lederbergia galactosidilytica TaxID=217031 RepID=A0A0Q9XYJ7_9BACI|nr:hypothetical protein [Lederbergia galactosidilytica]KRG09742.1 hypothetical protein ACA29_21380 [Lederbergia galactosidilytica]KRG13457.1 hypothetical protein ACA30_14875 [Virgibacillus soli]OAK72535.1 hypothetical protein ABB05_08055 [Lederbergia galactosidilytica]